MTPRMFSALQHHEEDLERARDRRAGVVAMLIANAHRDPEVHPEGFQPADFFPSLPRVEEEEEEEQGPEDHIRVLEFIATMVTGRKSGDQAAETAA